MNEFKNIDDILDFAIQAEQDAVDFYNWMAETAANAEMKQIFAKFAQEEMGHKAHLLRIKETGQVSLSTGQVTDLKISDYASSAVPRRDMSYADALILAMNREKAAFKLYLVLSERVSSEKHRELFLGLAMEESKHKLRFELEYDEYVLKEN